MGGSIIKNGVPWYDQNGNIVNAHGGCLIEAEGKYYLFGEYKTNDINMFNGFSCYSSKNLSDWYFEGLSLKPQKDGFLGPNRTGERVKVMKCEKSGKYVMVMHTDSQYNDPVICVAISDSVNGEFTLLGALKYNGIPIRKWDMGTFVDDDQKAYLILHEGDIYLFNDDYLSITEKVASNIAPGGESPVVFKKDGVYFSLFSNKTSWERNDNYYLSSDSLYGPWTYKGLFCPQGSLTYNSQSTFVFDSGGGAYMYMGDRWSFPRQADSATYVWLPLTIDCDSLVIPDYLETWDFLTKEQVDVHGNCSNLKFISKDKNDALVVSFEGSDLTISGETKNINGYAEFELWNSDGELVHRLSIDFYSLKRARGILYCTPQMKRDKYTLKISPLGATGNWTDKSLKIFGGTDCYIEVYEKSNN